MRRPIHHVAVLGAGTMGSQIAALFAEAGCSVLLLDVTEELARARSSASVTTASFDVGIPRLGSCDWVLEAVAEDLTIKRKLWQRVAPFLRTGAIASTNTSGISLAAIGNGLPFTFREQFLGVHFFNPPSKLRLVELIRGPDTVDELADDAVFFVTETLNKTVVEAKDTPNFIANRIGAFFNLTAQQLTVSERFSIQEVDWLTGPWIGLPKSGTYRLIDVIGLDVWARVTGAVQPFYSEMLRRGWLGEKAGAGFYRKVIRNDGEKAFEALDLQTFTYHPIQTQQALPNLSLPERLRLVFSHDDRASCFLRPLLTELFRYCHEVSSEIAYCDADLDRAMRFGYGWELGPFEIEAVLHE